MLVLEKVMIIHRRQFKSVELHSNKQVTKEEQENKDRDIGYIFEGMSDHTEKLLEVLP
jgi:hypothetical protein